MDGLTAAIDRLVAVKVVGQLWVNGSFLTEKIDPEDADLLLRIPSGFLERISAEQKETVEWFLDRERKATHHCDSYIWVEYPQDHDLHMLSERNREYWMRQYGLSRGKMPKGIAVIELAGGAA